MSLWELRKCDKQKDFLMYTNTKEEVDGVVIERIIWCSDHVIVTCIAVYLHARIAHSKVRLLN